MSKVNHEDMRVDYVLQIIAASLSEYLHCPVFNCLWAKPSMVSQILQVHSDQLQLDSSWILDPPHTQSPHPWGIWMFAAVVAPWNWNSQPLNSKETSRQASVFFWYVFWFGIESIIYFSNTMCISCILYMYTIYHETWWRRRCILTLHCVYMHI